MGVVMLNEETMYARVGDEEEQPQRGYTNFQCASMALDTP